MCSTTRSVVRSTSVNGSAPGGGAGTPSGRVRRSPSRSAPSSRSPARRPSSCSSRWRSCPRGRSSSTSRSPSRPRGRSPTPSSCRRGASGSSCPRRNGGSPTRSSWSTGSTARRSSRPAAGTGSTSAAGTSGPSREGRPSSWGTRRTSSSGSRRRKTRSCSRATRSRTCGTASPRFWSGSTRGSSATCRASWVSSPSAAGRTFLFENRPRIEAVLQGLNANVRTAKSVTHGDLHLGQVLRRAADGSLYFIDFEGEPERAPGQRAVKWPPLRDVGTMSRSFSYVKHYAWRDFIRGDATAALQVLEREKLEGTEGAVAQRLVSWETAAMEGFSQRYLRSTSLYPGLAAEDALKAIRGWMMEKALYEFRYELKHRPVNIFIPLEGIVALATGGGAGGGGAALRVEAAGP